MKVLPVSLLRRACRLFLDRAYPEGDDTIPPARRQLLNVFSDQPLASVLVPPLCQELLDAKGERFGYALRLGSVVFPHVKLQVVLRDDESCIFSVDTHDAIRLDPGHPDASGWTQLQNANRKLKEQIEHAWDAAGLLTFNGMLRRELEQKEGPANANPARQ